MDQIPVRRPRLNVFGRAARTRRIFARLREGWGYEEIAQEEGVSAERIRQIVSVALEKRVINQGAGTMPGCSSSGSRRRCGWRGSRWRVASSKPSRPSSR